MTYEAGSIREEEFCKAVREEGKRVPKRRLGPAQISKSLNTTNIPVRFDVREFSLPEAQIVNPKALIVTADWSSPPKIWLLLLRRWGCISNPYS